MSIDIHQLQVQAEPIVTSLYADLNLPLRAAKFTYSNGRYPTLAEIFDTLDAYKDEELVIQFSNNADMIASAKEVMATPIIAKEKEPDFDNPFGALDNTSERVPFVSVLDVLKEHSFADIEKCIANALHELTGKKIAVTLNDFHFDLSSYGSRNSLSFSAKVRDERRF